MGQASYPPFAHWTHWTSQRLEQFPMTDPWDDGRFTLKINQHVGKYTIVSWILFVTVASWFVVFFSLDSTVFNVSKQVVDEALAKKMQSYLVSEGRPLANG